MDRALDGVDNMEEELLRGRGVLAKIVSMSGLSGRLGRVAGELPWTSVAGTLRMDRDELLLQGRVGESRREGSFSLVIDR